MSSLGLDTETVKVCYNFNIDFMDLGVKGDREP